MPTTKRRGNSKRGKSRRPVRSPFPTSDPRTRRIDALERLLADGRPRSRPELHAIERQLDDLRTGHKRGLVWDEVEAERAIGVYSLLIHPEGEFAGERFVLEPWQECAIVAPLFGWWRLDTRDRGLDAKTRTRFAALIRKGASLDDALDKCGIPDTAGERRRGRRRRFRRAYIEIPRKNGKTALVAGIVHKLANFDDEIGAEVFCIAGSADQARTLFDKFCKGMISPELAPFYTLWDRAIECHEWKSVIKLLPHSAKTQHSAHPHGAVFDEVHVFPNRLMYDVMQTGVGKRRNSLILAITTAGHDRSSICWELHVEALKVLDPADHLLDDTLFAFVATVDEGDDWKDRETWRKANPNFGITVDEENLDVEATLAKRSPGALNSFLQLHLDRWTEQSVRHVSIDEWDACRVAIEIDELLGLPCAFALDCASTRDVVAGVFTFKRRKLAEADPDRFFWLPVFWAPVESIDERADRDRRQVKNWIERGLIRGLPGKAIDNRALAADVADLLAIYQPREIAFDPLANGRQVMKLLIDEHGIPEAMAAEFAQTMRMYNPVCVEFDRLLAERCFEHDGNDVLRWMASNVAMKRDDRGNMMPSKALSGDKIDGISAGLMSLFSMLFSADKYRVANYYETHEVEAF